MVELRDAAAWWRRPKRLRKPELSRTPPAGERVTWSGRGDQFRVLRRVGDEEDYTVAATVAGHEWTDTGIEYGKPYTYMVQALVDAGNQKVAESDLSHARTVTSEGHVPSRRTRRRCAPIRTG